MTIDGNPLTSIINDVEKKYITYDIRNYWKTLRTYKSRSQFGIAKNAYDVINAIINAKELSVSASVVLEGEYGENDVAMGVPVKLIKMELLKYKQLNLTNQNHHY